MSAKEKSKGGNKKGKEKDESRGVKKRGKER